MDRSGLGGTQQGHTHTSSVLRAVDRTLAEWRRNWIAFAQQAYVEAWQAAWTEGCSARWAGQPFESRPYRDAPKSDAWSAGWKWAHTQPDRRKRWRIDPNWAARRRFERRRAVMNAAKGGIVSFTLVAIARWMLRSSAARP